MFNKNGDSRAFRALVLKVKTKTDRQRNEVSLKKHASAHRIAGRDRPGAVPLGVTRGVGVDKSLSDACPNWLKSASDPISLLEDLL